MRPIIKCIVKSLSTWLYVCTYGEIDSHVCCVCCTHTQLTISKLTIIKNKWKTSPLEETTTQKKHFNVYMNIMDGTSMNTYTWVPRISVTDKPCSTIWLLAYLSADVHICIMFKQHTHHILLSVVRGQWQRAFSFLQGDSKYVTTHWCNVKAQSEILGGILVIVSLFEVQSLISKLRSLWMDTTTYKVIVDDL